MRTLTLTLNQYSDLRSLELLVKAELDACVRSVFTQQVKRIIVMHTPQHLLEKTEHLQTCLERYEMVSVAKKHQTVNVICNYLT
uniref:Uncharacterized protein n=1 Tax=Arion vulgaris TaxID=1028688 RepID=A0A0B7AZJ2_9EUPU